MVYSSKKFSVDIRVKVSIPSVSDVMNDNGNGKVFWERFRDLQSYQNRPDLSYECLRKVWRNCGGVIRELVAGGVVSLEGNYSVYKGSGSNKVASYIQDERMDPCFDGEYYPLAWHDIAMAFAKSVKNENPNSKQKVYVYNRRDETKEFV